MDNAWIQTMINEESNKYKNINVVTLFLKGTIPERKLKNALIHIAPDADRDDILLVLDNTVWGSNKEGLVFTGSRIYWNTTFVENSKGSMSYDEIDEVSVVKHALILNQTSINLVVSDDAKAFVRELLQNVIREIKKRKLTALRNFIEESFDPGEGSFRSMDYGSLKILIEHKSRIYVAVVVAGREPTRMRGTMKAALDAVWDAYKDALEKWNGIRIKGIDGLMRLFIREMVSQTTPSR